MNATPDQKLQINLDAYEEFLEHYDRSQLLGGNEEQQLPQFRSRWRELIPEAPRFVCRSSPPHTWIATLTGRTGITGAVRGSLPHAGSFIAAFRRKAHARR